MQIFIAETIGTMLLILLGDGVVANVLLGKTKGNNSGWIVITTAWAMAVFVGAYSVASVSGAHLNPAVTIGLAVAGAIPWGQVPPTSSRSSSARSSAPSWSGCATSRTGRQTTDPGLKLAVFSTGPAIRSTIWNLITEIIGTFVLMFGILAIKGAAMDGAAAGRAHQHGRRWASSRWPSWCG